MKERALMMIGMPVAFAMGVTIGATVGLLRPDATIVTTVLLTAVAAWIGVEVTLYIGVNLIALFGWSADQWVALYNAYKPILPNYVGTYARKRQERKDRKDKGNARSTL